jgi:hypothetical protein
VNVSIIGPEESGKTRLANMLALRAAQGRPIYVVNGGKSAFSPLPIENFGDVNNAVVIVDDANAVLDSAEIYTKDKRYKRPVIKARHENRLNIFIFHSFDDANKFWFRQSRYIYVSARYKDESFKKNRYIKGISPEVVGRKGFEFLRFKRY